MLFLVLLVAASAWTAMSLNADCILVTNECATKSVSVSTSQRFPDGSINSFGHLRVAPGGSLERCWGGKDYAKYVRITGDGKSVTFGTYTTVSACVNLYDPYYIVYKGGVYREYKTVGSSVIYADSRTCSGLGTSYELVDFVEYPAGQGLNLRINSGCGN